MRGFMVIIFFITALIGLQLFLSYRSNKLIGLIIPVLYLTGSIMFVCMLSDYLVAIGGFLILMIPMGLWLGIYKVCRKHIDQKNTYEINRMKINDL